MNEKRLDERLKQGKIESERFFSSANMDTARQSVLHQAPRPAARRGKSPGFRAAVAVCAACLLFLSIGGMLPGKQAPAKNGSEPGALSDPPLSDAFIVQQLISLSAEGLADYRVSFHPIAVPDQAEGDLMSILWQDQHAGTSEAIYYNLFEQSDQPFPVSVVGFPGATDKKILMISSASTTGGFLHYRLLEYSSGLFATILSQDYVPEGKLAVQDGVIIEQRQGEFAQVRVQASYLVPYIIEPSGEIFLPVDTLRMHVGDRVRFIGEQGNALRVSSQKGAASRIDEGNETPVPSDIAFIAGEAGDDTLLLVRESGGADKTMRLEILE